MDLTVEQLQIIRDSTTNDVAFKQVMAVIDEVQQQAATPTPVAESSKYFYEVEQIDLLSRTIDDLPVSIYVKDRDGHFVMANRYTIDSMHVPTQEDIIGKTDFDFLFEEDAQHHYQIEQNIMQTGTPLINYEIHIDDKYANERWLLTTKLPLYANDGEIIGIIGINRDITNQKNVEKKLEYERNLLRTLIDNIKDQIYVKDQVGRFLVANQATLEHNQVDCLEDIIGTTDFDYLPKEQAQSFYDAEQRVIETGVSIVDVEIKALLPEGDPEHHWLSITKVPIYDVDGNITGLVGVNRDITTQKLAALKTMEIELERKKSEFLKDFITGASHEFRTPISVLKSTAYLLTRVTDTARQEKHIAKLTTQTDKLENLIDRMLMMVDLDHMDNIDRENIRLNVLLQNAIDHVQFRQNTDDINIQLINSDMQVSAYCSESLMFRAMCEMLENAIYHTLGADDRQITLSCKYDNTEAIITVTDNGKGMIDKTIDLIFNRFYREDKSHVTSGFGLGLPIVKRIIDLHQGTIAVNSQLDIGTTFTITLPATSAAKNPLSP